VLELAGWLELTTDCAGLGGDGSTASYSHRILGMCE